MRLGLWKNFSTIPMHVIWGKQDKYEEMQGQKGQGGSRVYNLDDLGSLNYFRCAIWCRYVVHPHKNPTSLSTIGSSHLRALISLAMPYNAEWPRSKTPDTTSSKKEVKKSPRRCWISAKSALPTDNIVIAFSPALWPFVIVLFWGWDTAAIWWSWT